MIQWHTVASWLASCGDHLSRKVRRGRRAARRRTVPTVALRRLRVQRLPADGGVQRDISPQDHPCHSAALACAHAHTCHRVARVDYIFTTSINLANKSMRRVCVAGAGRLTGQRWAALVPLRAHRAPRSGCAGRGGVFLPLQPRPVKIEKCPECSAHHDRMTILLAVRAPTRGPQCAVTVPVWYGGSGARGRPAAAAQ